MDDTLHTCDRRAVGRLSPVFKIRLPIREAQIIQLALDRVRMRVVPAEGYSSADGEAIAQRIRDRMGDVSVDVESVDAIPRTASGKLRAVICELSDAELESVRSSRAELS